MPLYFAYGQDLDLQAFQQRIKAAAPSTDPVVPIAAAMLRTFKLVFRQLIASDARAFSDIAEEPTATVYGALFDLKDEQLNALDPPPAPGAEYERATVTVELSLPGRGPIPISGGPTLQDGQTVNAILHRATKKGADPAQPTREQVMKILCGALQSNLPLPWARSLFGAIAPTSSVDDIELGKHDGAGDLITKIYTKAPPNYAVYETDRVKVQYADDPAKGAEQRKAMADLNGLRSQITGLVNGWQAASQSQTPAEAATSSAASSGAEASRTRLAAFAAAWKSGEGSGPIALWEAWRKSKRANSRAKRYNARLAAALILCFEDDAKNAFGALQGILDDITAERQSLGRLQYLLGAFWVSAALVTIFFLFRHTHWPHFYEFPPNAAELLLAARAGTVGAFFSIALSLESRTTQTDLHMRDNVIAAALRVVIGAISGTVLVLLLQTEAVQTLSAGGVSLKSLQGWQAVLLVGFVAGFLERLVPDLLEKSK